MTTDEVLTGVGLILVLAVGSQVLASRLRIPVLIVGAMVVGPEYNAIIAVALGISKRDRQAVRCSWGGW